MTKNFILLFCSFILCYGELVSQIELVYYKPPQKTSACNNFSTFWGGNSLEQIKGAFKQMNGDLVITGFTNSNNLNITNGIISDTLVGDQDAFVAKFDSCGNFIWATYLGSSNFDQGEKIICNAIGEIFVCGSTDGINFPTSIGCYQNANGGNYDAFICKLNANGTINWSSYFGKNGGDLAYDLSLDKNGNVYIGGSTSSNNLPTTPQSHQQNFGGAMDAWVASFTNTGNFRWCTYFGGSASEDLHVMTADKSGNIYLAGGTFSTNIVMSANAYQQFNNGGMEIYIAKLDSSGNELWSTYLGDTGLDDCYALVCDSAENIYLSGLTYSALFPTTIGCHQNTINLFADMYLTKFTSSGNLIWSTFYGGSNIEDCKSLCLNSNQDITLFGRTQSTDMQLFGSPLQSTQNGNFDFFIARCDSSGSFFYSSYLGGNNEEEPNDIVGLNNNYCYLVGGSYSTDYPVISGSFQTNLNGTEDGVITKLFLPINPSLSVTEKKQDEICLFPNPSTNYFYIDLKENNQLINIISLKGELKKIISNFEIGKNKIEIEDLENGIYFVELISNKKITRSKLIISR